MFPTSCLRMSWSRNALLGVLWVAALTSSVLVSRPRMADGAVELGDIIKNVHTNERLYDNVEVLLREEYRDFRERKEENVLMQRNVTIRYVIQDGMFQVRVEGAAHLSGTDGPRPRDRIRLFDGTTSRALEGTRANIVDGPTVDGDMIRPHMLILQVTGRPVPLSTYLQGHKAMLSSPAGDWASWTILRDRYPNKARKGGKMGHARHHGQALPPAVAHDHD
jgi:hypothetical protein